MKNFIIRLFLIGLITNSSTTHGMLRSFFGCTKRFRPLPTKISQQPTRTPNEYYDYTHYHSHSRMNEWKKQKNALQHSIAHANNNRELIENIVNHPEYDTTVSTPLCDAIIMNDFEFVQFLLQYGARINDTVTYAPPLFSTTAGTTAPIFFSKTVEMTQLLHDNGADIRLYDSKTGGFTGKMNLLHQAIHCRNMDDRLFDYLLTQGLNPNSLIPQRGDNLWHSLIYCRAYFCPEKRLFDRVKKLHDLGINPYQKNIQGESAIDTVEKDITSQIDRAHLKRLLRLRDEMKTVTTTQFKDLNTTKFLTNE